MPAYHRGDCGRRHRRGGMGRVVLSFMAAILAGGIDGAAASDCHGNPDALGVSRVLAVDPTAHPDVGSQQYGETLPLADHEIVLTFDDGPIPKYSNRILDILARECVKATFFAVGEMAKAHPDGVKRLFAEGHSVGTHSMRHPLSFHRMGEDAVRAEVDGGIRETVADAGDAGTVAPFFRIPGLLKSPTVERYLRDKGLMNWSVDFSADDWHRISGERVAEFAIRRIEERKRGILLLHDIHERTVEALPIILRELKARGYRIVHVVAATASMPATPSLPEDWLASPSRTIVAKTTNVDSGNRHPSPPDDVPAVFELQAPAPAIDTTGIAF